MMLARNFPPPPPSLPKIGAAYLKSSITGLCGRFNASKIHLYCSSLS